MACDSERPWPLALQRPMITASRSSLAMKGSSVYMRSPRPQHAGLQDAREAPTTLTPGCPHHAGLRDAQDAPATLTPGCPHHAGLRDAPATLASRTPGMPGDAEHDSRAPSASSQFSPLHPLMRLRVDHTGKP